MKEKKKTPEKEIEQKEDKKQPEEEITLKLTPIIHRTKRLGLEKEIEKKEPTTKELEKEEEQRKSLSELEEEFKDASIKSEERFSYEKRDKEEETRNFYEQREEEKHFYTGGIERTTQKIGETYETRSLGHTNNKETKRKRIIGETHRSRGELDGFMKQKQTRKYD